MSYPSFSIIVPTLNAGPGWEGLLADFARQSLQPVRRVVIDSGSSDQTVALASRAGWEVLTLAADRFDHGGVRQLALEQIHDGDFMLFCTQDIRLCEATCLARLLAAFDDPAVGAAFGRQVPYDQAPLGEQLARRFNYPPQSRTTSLADKDRLGLRSAFLSNSFAAYRRSALEGVGGFPSPLIFGEDMFVAAKLLLENWHIAYRADAAVWHSHSRGFAKLMRRSFDIGVFHSQVPWLLETFSQPEGEGLRLLADEVTYYWRQRRRSVMAPIMRNSARFAAYRLGRLHRHLPLWLNQKLSLNRSYWRTKAQ